MSDSSATVIRGLDAVQGPRGGWSVSLLLIAAAAAAA